jgi:dTDP-4-dehydrorhamnose 3,5-epimerase
MNRTLITMRFEPTAIPDVVKVVPKRFGDERGHFSEIFRADLFAEALGPTQFVQDNVSLSRDRGTLRGLHFQIPPKVQGKLIRCLQGAIRDVVVDLRRGSSTYGRHVALDLTADDGAWLWVPSGFAHGFCTLVTNTEVLYKVTDYYSPTHDKGLAYDDPALSIDWPVDAGSAILSGKDRVQPRLLDLPDYFQI